ncbi:hypothetical protein [Microbulbifer sp. SAOS-129_SWC]|uniref:hypothetical protein n=1 Tax=Microbulbifer sp. SAOS-129_SWC TaxID=3145235 RepID=UPI003216561D
MAGYFEDLLDSYQPSENTAAANTPWTDPIAEDTAADLPFSDTGTRPSTDYDIAPPAQPVAPAAETFPEQPQAAAESFEEPRQLPEAEPLETVERVVERETRIIENVAEVSPPPEPDNDMPRPLPDADAFVPEEIDPPTTHVHQHFAVAESRKAFEPDPDNSAPPPPADRYPAPEPAELPEHRPDPTLAAIETELARALDRLHGDGQAQQPFVSADDFEPEAADHPIPADIESVREVTREVVTEIHHHHTTESRVEPPAAPAPRTAAEASRIGPIRFAAAWKTGER